MGEKEKAQDKISVVGKLSGKKSIGIGRGVNQHRTTTSTNHKILTENKDRRTKREQTPVREERTTGDKGVRTQ